MDYKKIYDALIGHARGRKIEQYTEKHHVIPRCLNGSDDESNLVSLTPEEHYTAHQLLVKIYPGNVALVNAAVMMMANRPSNKLYGWLRRRHSLNQSNRQTGQGNTQFGTRWIHNETLKQSKKIKKSEELPNGWSEGRKINFDPIGHICKVCNVQFKRIKLENYCSSVCKKADTSDSKKIIDKNLDSMLAYYQTVWSIDKTLKHFGITGSRAGNKYFSSILKNKSIYIQRRRNSS